MCICVCQTRGDNLQVCCDHGMNQLQRNFELYPKTVEGSPKPDLHNDDEMKRWPTRSEIAEEVRSLSRISGPVALMGLLLFLRGMISMQFLGYLGDLQLAGGSLAIGFANITGYSVISGLAMGMEPICGQAYGANQWKVLGLCLQKTILILLCAAVPIGLFWLNIENILLWCGQDESITKMAGTYILYSLPDLIAQCFLHPLRIYLRTQNTTLPLTVSAAMALILHGPINFLLVVYFKLSIRGVALAAVWSNFNIVICLICYILLSGIYKKSLPRPTRKCLQEWASFLNLAIPSCASVCLEWWWYEFMILLCGLLVNPQAKVASMGILIQTTSLLYIFPSSLGLGVSTRVGNELGANRPFKARTATTVGIGCAVLLSLFALSFTLIVRDAWGLLFSRDEEILSLVSAALPIVGLCEVGNWPQTTGCGVLRGSARPTIGANINLSSFYLVGTPVALVFCFVIKFEFVGLWMGMLAAQASCVTLMFIALLRTDWKMQAERAKQLTSSAGGKPAEKQVEEPKCEEEDAFVCAEDVPSQETEAQPLLAVVTE